MGIESDLLLVGASWICVDVGMEVASLSIEMAKCDCGTESDVSKSIFTAFTIETLLELELGCEILGGKLLQNSSSIIPHLSQIFR